MQVPVFLGWKGLRWILGFIRSFLCPSLKKMRSSFLYWQQLLMLEVVRVNGSHRWSHCGIKLIFTSQSLGVGCDSTWDGHGCCSGALGRVVAVAAMLVWVVSGHYENQHRDDSFFLDLRWPLSLQAGIAGAAAWWFFIREGEGDQIPDVSQHSLIRFP